MAGPFTVNKFGAGEIDESLVAMAAAGDFFLIPAEFNSLSVTLGVTGGSGRVETTTNKVADVESDTNVVWVPWDAGDVVATTQDVAARPTAIRQVNISGTTRLMVTASK